MNQIGKEDNNAMVQDIQLQCSEALNTLNINVVSPELEEIKPKKMGSNRRKKQKLRQKKQQSRKVLHEIIKSMCSLKTNFEQNEQIIDALLQVDLDEDRFYEFISKVTREEMDILAQQIHSLTANFCLIYKDDEAINPAEIARLFQLIQIVKQASVQIEKIINFFIIKTEHADVEGYLHHNLELSTLKYIIQSDPAKVLGSFYIVRKTLRIFVFHLQTALKTNDKKSQQIKYQIGLGMHSNSMSRISNAISAMMNQKQNKPNHNYNKCNKARRKKRRRKTKINSQRKQKMRIEKQKFMLKWSKIQGN